MATDLRGVVKWIKDAVREADTRPDSILLEQFLRHGDEKAFALIMRRHGPMVLGVCRRMLGDAHDTEDAFQATFLVLIKKARSIARPEQLGGWLYGVAFRTAQKARFRRARRRAVEGRSDELLPEPAVASPATPDWLALLDQELLSLWERYRLPLVLCELQGLSRREAARRLGLAEGTLSSRLARGRQLLRRRLIRRGITLSAAALLAGLAPLAKASVPQALAGSTLKSALLLGAAPGLAAAMVPAAVSALMEGVLKTMFLAKLKIALVILPALMALATVGLLGTVPTAAKAPGQAQAADQPRPRHESANPAKPTDNSKRVVALIFGDIAITREELGEYLIARYGADKLEQFVNRRIIEHVCAKKGIAVTPEDVAAGFKEDLASLQLKQADFVDRVLKSHGKTLFEWQEDVVKPRLLLRKLCHDKVTVTEDDLRKMFEHRYGQKVHCKVIVWKKGEQARARKTYHEIGKDGGGFDQAFRRAQASAMHGKAWEVAALGRNLTSADDDAVVEEAFKLKPGEVSRLLTRKDGVVLIKCISHIPAVEGKNFETERPGLIREVTELKMAQAIPKLFKATRAEAKPRILLSEPRR